MLKINDKNIICSLIDFFFNEYFFLLRHSIIKSIRFLLLLLRNRT